MSLPKKDPIGQAIKDFHETGKERDIIVSSDICEDDVIPVAYLFRAQNELPELEQLALQHASGKILDVGAAAGTHALALMEANKNVEAIDISPLSVEYMQSKGINARNMNFFDLKNEKFDTVLLLMNGLGIAGSLSGLRRFLRHCKSLLTENGKVICDSTDIKYLYEGQDGSMWVDLASEYYGNFKFRMSYNEHQTDWFDWLYVDPEQLKLAAEDVGMQVDIVFEEDNHYLAIITKA